MKADEQLKILIGFSIFVILVGILLLLFTTTSNMSLSDETKELVDDLRMKHYGYSTLYATDDSAIYYDAFSHWSWSMTFDNGILTIETQDGTWFVEMQRKER